MQWSSMKGDPLQMGQIMHTGDVVLAKFARVFWGRRPIAQGLRQGGLKGTDP